jgi:hypothetical protein
MTHGAQMPTTRRKVRWLESDGEHIEKEQAAGGTSLAAL